MPVFLFLRELRRLRVLADDCHFFDRYFLGLFLLLSKRQLCGGLDEGECERPAQTFIHDLQG